MSAKYGINKGVIRHARELMAQVITKLMTLADMVTQMARDKDVRHSPDS
jgi:hypothetical protein